MAAGRKKDNSGSVCDICVVLIILIRNFDLAKLKLIFWFTPPPVLKLVKRGNPDHKKPGLQHIV